LRSRHGVSIHRNHVETFSARRGGILRLIAYTLRFRSERMAVAHRMQVTKGTTDVTYG
jgi:hypothetical protein